MINYDKYDNYDKLIQVWYLFYSKLDKRVFDELHYPHPVAIFQQDACIGRYPQIEGILKHGGHKTLLEMVFRQNVCNRWTDHFVWYSW